ncbi:MAG: hypothetical protein Q8K82_12930 [Gemmatimonadaceae bacterium]|nr:hypothetical protein [Gemmatimonadaceae bacterium]
MGATTLRDGTIAVGDERLLRVLFFTRNGKPIASLGRRGGGPGEFQTLMWMGQCGGDTLSVFDPAQARVTRVDAKGKLVGVRPAMPPGPVGYSQSMGPVPYILGCGRRGAFAVVGWPHQLPPTRPGPHRSTVSIRVAREVASEYKSLGTFAGPERYRFPKSDGPRPFGKTVLVALSENRVFVGTADSFYVEMYDLDGVKKGSIRREIALKRFRAPDKAFYLGDIIRPLATAAEKQRIRQAVDEMEFPEYLPAYGHFVVDAMNRLWIEEAYAAADASRQWWAFAEDGTAISSLRTPAQFEMYEINESYVLGKWTSRDGEESVRSYALVRMSGT